MTVTTLSPQPRTDLALPKAQPRQGISADFDTFLRMLTTQLQNQDPTSPMESAEFAVQLATFSGVEQQMKTNDLLQGLGSQIGVIGMAELAGWVGKEARAAVPARFAGTALSLVISPDSRSDAAALIVRDATGKVVARQAVPPVPGEVEWRGSGEDGLALPSGLYSFEVESSANGAVIGTAMAETYGRIVEARGGKGGMMLILDGGVEVPAADVTAMRNP